MRDVECAMDLDQARKHVQHVLHKRKSDTRAQFAESVIGVSGLTLPTVPDGSVVCLSSLCRPCSGIDPRHSVHPAPTSTHPASALDASVAVVGDLWLPVRASASLGCDKEAEGAAGSNEDEDVVMVLDGSREEKQEHEHVHGSSATAPPLVHHLRHEYAAPGLVRNASEAPATSLLEPAVIYRECEDASTAAVQAVFRTPVRLTDTAARAQADLAGADTPPTRVTNVPAPLSAQSLQPLPAPTEDAVGMGGDGADSTARLEWLPRCPGGAVSAAVLALPKLEFEFKDSAASTTDSSGEGADTGEEDADSVSQPLVQALTLTSRRSSRRQRGDNGWTQGTAFLRELAAGSLDPLTLVRCHACLCCECVYWARATFLFVCLFVCVFLFCVDA